MANAVRFLPPSAQLTRGTPMRIPVVVVLAKPTKVRGIHATFRGAEETKADYTTTSTDAKGNVSTERHTAVQLTDITTQSQLLVGRERLGFIGNVSDAFATMLGGGKHELLPPGEYPFEIEVVIPTDAPATHIGKKSRVFYELAIQVDIPLAFDLNGSQAFEVAPLAVDEQEPVPVRIRYPEDMGKPGMLDAMFTPNVKMEVALLGDRYHVGETIEGIVKIDSQDPLKISAIRVRLMGVESSQAHGHSDQAAFPGEPQVVATPGEIQGSFHHEFSFPAGPSGPLTTVGKLFRIDWFVQIELDVPWAKDPVLRVPVVLLN